MLNAVLCAKLTLAAEARINKYTLPVKGGMLQLKHVAFWTFQQAVSMYRNMQGHGWEFSLCFRELPAPS